MDVLYEHTRDLLERSGHHRKRIDTSLATAVLTTGNDGKENNKVAGHIPCNRAYERLPILHQLNTAQKKVVDNRKIEDWECREVEAAVGEVVEKTKSEYCPFLCIIVLTDSGARTVSRPGDINAATASDSKKMAPLRSRNPKGSSKGYGHSSTSRSTDLKCYKCGIIGHIARNCDDNSRSYDEEYSAGSEYNQRGLPYVFVDSKRSCKKVKHFNALTSYRG